VRLQLWQLLSQAAAVTEIMVAAIHALQNHVAASQDLAAQNHFARHKDSNILTTTNNKVAINP
jgi:hypothetical protein